MDSTQPEMMFEATEHRTRKNYRYAGPWQPPDEKEIDERITPGVNNRQRTSNPMKTKPKQRTKEPANRTIYDQTNGRSAQIALPPEAAHWTDYTQLDWFKQLDKDQQKKCDNLAHLAEETQIALNGAVSVYVSLVEYVQRSQLKPDIVQEILRARGYNDSRISEIRRVADSEPALLEALKNRTIGFKAAVERARELAGTTRASKLHNKLNKAVRALVKFCEKQEHNRWEETEGPWRIIIEKIEKPEPEEISGALPTGN